MDYDLDVAQDSSEEQLRQEVQPCAV